MACPRVDFLALLLLADLHWTRARATFEEAQQVQPSTATEALSRSFAASTSGSSVGFPLQLHSSPGGADTETPQRDDGPETRLRHRPLDQASAEQEHVHLLAADASSGGGEGEREGRLLLDHVDNASVDADVHLRRRRGLASRTPAIDGDAAGATAGAMAEVRGGFASLRGQCDDGDRFTVTSAALPIADGCYSAVVGTSFGEGFFYSTDEEDKRLIYPKLITRDGVSQYFWASAAFGEFSGGTSPIDCLSVEPTSTYIHPAAATWQCDADGNGLLEMITDQDFFVVCGCGTTATSGSSSSSSNVTPAPSETRTNTSPGAEIFTTTPTAAPSGSPATPNTPAPTTIPTPAASATISPPSSTSPPATEREISGCGRRIASVGSLAALSLGAGVCASFVAAFGALLL